MTEAGFSLGSNLGDRLGFLRQAVRSLAAVPGVRLVAQSPVYETEPVGVKPEHRHLSYLNAVVVMESGYAAVQWLERIKEIEQALGRVRGADRYAPRTLDIDLIYHGTDMLDSQALVVPHPRWATRRFVVQPLADVRPDLILPGAPQSVRAVRDALSRVPGESVRLFAREW